MVTELDQRLRSVIAESLGIQPARIAAEAHLMNDLSVDSLDLISLVMAIEEEYGVEISDAQTFEIATVGDLARLIDQLAGQTAQKRM